MYIFAIASIQRRVSSATDGDGGGCPSFLTLILNTYKTGLRVSEVIRKTTYEWRSEWPGSLTGEVEVGDVHLKGGQQGRTLAGGDESEGNSF